MDREITLAGVVGVCWRGRWLIVTGAFVGLVVGLALWIGRPTVYQATSSVMLGQATGVGGKALPSPFTNAQTAPGALDMHTLATTTGRVLGIPTATVRRRVRVSTPPRARVDGPQLIVVTASSRYRHRAIALANQFARAVVRSAGAPARRIERVLAAQAARAQARASRVAAQMRTLSAQAAARPPDAVRLAVDSTLLTANQSAVTTARLTLAQVAATGAARVVVTASASVPEIGVTHHLADIGLAGLAGILVGLVAAFIRQGSPAARRL